MAKGQKTGGRTKGTPNKTTGEVKALLLAVNKKLGGEAAMLAWAETNQTEFYKLLGRLIPQEVSGPDGGPVEFAGIIRSIVRPTDKH